VRRRLAVLRHVEEITGNVAMTCRYFGISRRLCYVWLRQYRDERVPAAEGQPPATPVEVLGRPSGPGAGAYPPVRWPQIAPFASLIRRRVVSPTSSIETTGRSRLVHFAHDEGIHDLPVQPTSGMATGAARMVSSAGLAARSRLATTPTRLAALAT
jgi:Helix-turn-helix domain